MAVRHVGTEAKRAADELVAAAVSKKMCSEHDAYAPGLRAACCIQHGRKANGRLDCRPASLASVADGPSQLSFSETCAAPVTLIKQRGSKIGDATLARQDTGEVIYTIVTRYPSLHVDVCRGADLSGKAMATIRTWSLDLQGVSGITNVKESNFLYSHKPLTMSVA